MKNSGGVGLTDNTCDFLVIGGGIAGAAAAYFLSPHGRVILLEMESQPGFHSTGRSAAVLTENYGSEPIREMTIASRAFLATPPEGFAEHPLLTPRGVLWVASADQQRELKSLASEARRLVPSIQELGEKAVLGLCPALRPDHATAGLLEPHAMDIDVAGLHQGFLRGVRQRGGEIASKRMVTTILRHADTWRVAAGNSTYQAPVVVNAAGAWCDEIAALAGIPALGLVPRRRTAFTFDPGISVADWPFVVDLGGRFYFKPEGGGLMGSPVDETPIAPGDVGPDELDVAVGVHHIQQATIMDIRHLQSKWAGLRSFFADDIPVIDEFPRGSGFYWLAGLGGYGIMTSPAVGETLASCVINGGMLKRETFSATRSTLNIHRRH